MSTTAASYMAHVINVAAQTERMSHMAGSLTALGIPMRRSPAVTFDDIPEAMTRYGATAIAQDLTQGEIACFLSHVQVWHAIAQGDDDWALVLEDDVLFAADTRAALEFATEAASAGLVKLESWGRTKSIVAPTRPRSARGDHEIFHYFGGVGGSAAYLLSRDGARFLLSTTLTLTRPVDKFLFMPPPAGLRVQILSPAVVVQSDRLELCDLPSQSPWHDSVLPVFASSLNHDEPARPTRKLFDSIRNEVRRLVFRTGLRIKRRRRVVIPLSGHGPLQVPRETAGHS